MQIILIHVIFSFFMFLDAFYNITEIIIALSYEFYS